MNATSQIFILVLIAWVIGIIFRAIRSVMVNKKWLRGEQRYETIELIKQLKSEKKGFHEILNILSEKGIMKEVAEGLIIEADNKLQAKFKDPDVDIQEEEMLIAQSKITPDIQYYINSYKNFKSGLLNPISTLYQTEAETKSLKSFIDFYKTQKLFRGFYELTQTFPPDLNEYMISYKNNDFFLTNKRLILHDREAKSNGDWTEVRLKDIMSYKTKISWTGALFIQLKSGKDITMKNFNSVADENAVNKIIEKKLYQ